MQPLLRFLASLIARLPPRTWYTAAWLAASAVALWPRSHSRRFESAIVLNRLLAYLHRTGRPFPIRWRVDTGTSIRAHEQGVILCSAHLPLVKVALRALLEQGVAMDAAIAEQPDGDGRLGLWGTPRRLPAIRTGPEVLLRVRRRLRSGATVVGLVDTPEGVYSPNLLILSGRAYARLLFFLPELMADGTVQVRVVRPPAPECATVEEVQANLDFLRRQVDRIRRAEPLPADSGGVLELAPEVGVALRRDPAE